MEKYYDFIYQKKHQMYDSVKEIVEHESPSHEKELLDQLATWISNQFETLTEGKTKIIKNEQYGNHVVGEFGTGDKQLLILAHFDTVWEKGTLEKKPFSIKDGIARGPGVFDMKTGLIQSLYALHALKELGTQLNKKIICIFDGDEEIGNPSSKQLIEDEAKKSEAVFVLEPAMSPKGSLKTTRKGVGIFTIKVTGVPAHSGIDPEKGVSAIEELADIIKYFQSLNDYEKGTTLNVGTIRGGTTSNVVAEEAFAVLDLRAKTKEEFERVIPLIKGVKAKKEGANVVIEGGVNRFPLERTKEVENMFITAKDLAKKHLGLELTEKETGGGSDGNLTAPYAPTLDGLGAVGDGAHANHEYVVLEEMPKRTALLAMLLETYGK
ncbi:M20 family metallopeptidase [Oceanobacillus locisalsi]|uniref:M20 family metallopeptidase n=1 Tax=Oceanobacillus locisalsi TaxID=546107 RepID=A0ABW3NJZ2_9BACI